MSTQNCLEGATTRTPRLEDLYAGECRPSNPRLELMTWHGGEKDKIGFTCEISGRRFTVPAGCPTLQLVFEVGEHRDAMILHPSITARGADWVRTMLSLEALYLRMEAWEVARQFNKAEEAQAPCLGEDAVQLWMRAKELEELASHDLAVRYDYLAQA